MAAIISTELISYISPVLIFIFIWAILYAVLQKFESFGKNQPINASIAFVGALLFIFMPFAGDIIKTFVPSMVLIIIVIMIILMILMFMGYKEVDITTYMKENSFGAVITTIVLVIFLVVLGKVFGPAFSQYPSPDEIGIGSEIRRVLFNPKVLGMILVFAIAFYLIKSISIPMKAVKK